MSELSSPTSTPELERLHEAIDQARHVTLEIGTGLTPMVSHLDPHHFDGPKTYVAWNVGRLAHETMSEYYVDEHRFAVYTPMEQREDIHDILPPASVNQIVISNVFCEESKATIPKGWGSSGTEEKLRTLELATDLLKQNGELVITDSYSPKLSVFADRTIGIEILKVLGYFDIKYIDRRNQEFNQRRRQLGLDHTRAMEGAYILTALKR